MSFLDISQLLDWTLNILQSEIEFMNFMKLIIAEICQVSSAFSLNKTALQAASADPSWCNSKNRKKSI